MKVSTPKKSASGEYSIDPSGLMAVMVPLEGPDTIATEVASTVPSSTSASLMTRLVTTGRSSSVVLASSLASGASFTAVTVTVTVAWSQSTGSPGSQTSYMKLSTPKKSVSGV